MEVTGLVEGEDPSTKAAALALAAVSQRKNLLVVVEATDLVTRKSLRNVSRVHQLVPGQLNTYDVLCSDDVVFTQGALEAFVAGATAGKGEKAEAPQSEEASE